MHLAVDGDGRSQRAATDAGNALEFVFAVVGGPTRADAQTVVELLHDLAPAAYMASGALAHPDRVFGGRLESKLRIEGGDAVDFVVGDADRRRQSLHCLFREVPVALLYLLEQGNEVLPPWGMGIESQHFSY